jgi:uncharacterized protein DUF3618
MGEDERQVGEAVAADARTPEQIQADIERTRRELGDTVAAVAEKADVKARARARAQETRERLLNKKHAVASKTRAAAPDSADQALHTVARTARENQRALVIAAATLTAFALGRISARP